MHGSRAIPTRSASWSCVKLLVRIKIKLIRFSIEESTLDRLGFIKIIPIVKLNHIDHRSVPSIVYNIYIFAMDLTEPRLQEMNRALTTKYFFLSLQKANSVQTFELILPISFSKLNLYVSKLNNRLLFLQSFVLI